MVIGLRLMKKEEKKLEELWKPKPLRRLGRAIADIEFLKAFGIIKEKDANELVNKIGDKFLRNKETMVILGISLGGLALFLISCGVLLFILFISKQYYFPLVLLGAIIGGLLIILVGLLIKRRAKYQTKNNLE